MSAFFAWGPKRGERKGGDTARPRPSSRPLERRSGCSPAEPYPPSRRLSIHRNRIRTPPRIRKDFFVRQRISFRKDFHLRQQVPEFDRGQPAAPDIPGAAGRSVQFWNAPAAIGAKSTRKLSPSYQTD